MITSITKEQKKMLMNIARHNNKYELNSTTETAAESHGKENAETTITTAFYQEINTHQPTSNIHRNNIVYFFLLSVISQSWKNEEFIDVHLIYSVYFRLQILINIK